jgi:hypothetical protein
MFYLEHFVVFQPDGDVIPMATDVQWTHTGGTAPGAVVSSGGAVSVTGEGTVVVRGEIPASENGGKEIAATFTLTFAAGTIKASLHGLDIFYVGVPAVGELRFELEDAVFHAVIFAEDFRVTGLPRGLQAGAPVRVSDTQVVIPVTGTPETANPSPSTLSVMATLPGRNVLRGNQPLGVNPATFTLPAVYTSAFLRVQRAVFDLNPDNPARHTDVQVRLFTNEQEYHAVMYGGYRLVEGIDFTLLGNDTFRIHASFLRQLPVGEWPLTFAMRRGASPDFTLEIIDSRIIVPDEPQPRPPLDRRLLEPPPPGDQMLFTGGGTAISFDALGLGAGFARIRPALQNGRASLWLRADVLEYLAWEYPDAVLEVYTRIGSLRFPTSLLDLLRGAKAAIAEQRLDYDQVYVRITLTDVSRDASYVNQVQGAYPGGEVLAPLVDLNIELIRRATQEVFFTVREFTRPLEWTQAVLPRSGFVRFGAFWFNPNGRLDFAPHRSGGPNEVVIRSIYTGVHGILHNGVIPADVPATHWGYESAYTAVYKGIVQAARDVLSPHEAISRAEFAFLLSLALQLPSPGFLPDSYRDVPEDFWAFDAISRARYARVLNGETFFRPSEPITRQEMVSMVAEAIVRGQPVRPPEHKPLSVYFTDHRSIATRHVLNVQTALDYGIFIGYPDSTFRPNAPATRIEAVAAAVALARLMGNLD